MNISIVTYYAENGNYGALYQAFALNEYLVGIGHDVSFWGDKFLERKVYTSEYMEQKAQGMNCVRDLYFNIDYKHNKTYDVTFVGSDQVWGGKEERFWGVGLKTRVLATYAPSVGNLITSKIKWKAILKGITGRIAFYCHKKDLIKFHNISVRDNQTKALIKMTLNKLPTLVLDPTFLIDWNKYLYDNNGLPLYQIPKEPYVLIYSYGFGKEAEDNILNYANKNGFKTCVVNYNSNRFDYSGAYTPFQTLALFKNAEMVFTDTFHGTVFSLIFNRQMYVLGKNKVSKPFMLLSQFGLTDRCVRSYNEKELNSCKIVDYNECNKKIDKLINISKEYIDECINMAENNKF